MSTERTLQTIENRTPEIIENEIRNLENELYELKAKKEHEELEKFMKTTKGKWFKHLSSEETIRFFKIVDVKFTDEYHSSPAEISVLKLIIGSNSISVHTDMSGIDGDYLTYFAECFAETDETNVINTYNDAIAKMQKLAGLLRRGKNA